MWLDWCTGRRSRSRSRRKNWKRCRRSSTRRTPDARIAAAENLLTKFADTEFKAIALQVAAASAQQKNDFEKMVVYAERTLEADPKNYPAMLMLANGIAQRTREFDLDKEEKLGRAEKYANSAMELVKAATKPRPDIPDADWEAAKQNYYGARLRGARLLGDGPQEVR